MALPSTKTVTSLIFPSPLPRSSAFACEATGAICATAGTVCCFEQPAHAAALVARMTATALLKKYLELELVRSTTTHGAAHVPMGRIVRAPGLSAASLRSAVTPPCNNGSSDGPCVIQRLCRHGVVAAMEVFIASGARNPRSTGPRAARSGSRMIRVLLPVGRSWLDSHARVERRGRCMTDLRASFIHRSSRGSI
jgi:hypothetical protein